MQSRFVLSPNPEPRGVAPHVVVAAFFFLLGAIASSALYPHVDTDRGVSRNAPAPAKADSNELNAFSQRESTQYTGGPIPGPTFTTQAVADVATKESLALPNDDRSSSAANSEKTDHTTNKLVRKQEYSRGRNETPNRRYREQPSYEAAARYWNPWDWGRFERPFVMSR
jgi:hypothetical protein